LNVTDTWQLPLAEIDDPHEFASTLNGAAALIDEIFHKAIINVTFGNWLGHVGCSLERHFSTARGWDG